MLKQLGLASLALLSLAAESVGGSLQVSNVIIDVAAPNLATTVSLRNTGQERISAQLRIFKWRQANGTEELLPTDEVVASPPLAKLEPGKDYAVRVVRVSRAPMEREESFRLVIDELPEPKASKGLGVSIAMRYSLPVFFGTSAGQPASGLRWQAETQNGALRLSASNPGARRVRIASIKIKSSDGRPIVSRDGLFGYVLSGSQMSWVFPLDKKMTPAASLAIMATSDSGSINAQVPVLAER